MIKKKKSSKLFCDSCVEVCVFEMKIPNDWIHKQRNITQSGLNNGKTTNARGKKTLNSAELETFVEQMSYKNVVVNSSFLSSFGNDKETISKKIIEMLPGQYNESGVDESLRTKKQKISDGTACTTERSEMKLELGTLLSRLPYKRMIQELLPCNLNTSLPSVPTVSRIYEGCFFYFLRDATFNDN